MSLKRILIRILMLLLLWGALYGMFILTQGIQPWIRVALGIGICAVYTFAQMKINRKMYGQADPNNKGKSADKK